MIYWTLKWIVVSLILIFLIHYLYLFFKTNLTVPKVKDLVKSPTFSIVNEYLTSDNKIIYHFDFFRIKKPSTKVHNISLRNHLWKKTLSLLAKNQIYF